MRLSILSISITLIALASSGLSAAIPRSSITPTPALWKNRIHEEVNPKSRTVDSRAPSGTAWAPTEFDHLLEPAARAIIDCTILFSLRPKNSVATRHMTVYTIDWTKAIQVDRACKATVGG
ncbi:hypothetical protein BS17DRAFT_766947 [Gyrodon lividus]|nr:hypothetical protein BS17DRAFT_766947 [Gyrodon lividus]